MAKLFLESTDPTYGGVTCLTLGGTAVSATTAATVTPATIDATTGNGSTVTVSTFTLSTGVDILAFC